MDPDDSLNQENRKLDSKMKEDDSNNDSNEVAAMRASDQNKN
jgi:hypothetical protein